MSEAIEEKEESASDNMLASLARRRPPRRAERLLVVDALLTMDDRSLMERFYGMKRTIHPCPYIPWFPCIRHGAPLDSRKTA